MFPPAPTTHSASGQARTVVTWAGAALLLAGAPAFATVIWRQSGESGRLAILGAVTLLAFAGADRLRRMTPTTAEAFTTIAARTVFVDAVSAHHGGYAFGWQLTAWFAVTLLSAPLACSLRFDSTWVSDRALATAVVALAATGVGVLTSRVTDPASRGALLPAAWSAWGVQVLLAPGEAVASLVGFGFDGGSAARWIELAPPSACSRGCPSWSAYADPAGPGPQASPRPGVVPLDDSDAARDPVDGTGRQHCAGLARALPVGLGDCPDPAGLAGAGARPLGRRRGHRPRGARAASPRACAFRQRRAARRRAADRPRRGRLLTGPGRTGPR